MKTVPLGGAKAAGRVALVDDADYDLVMQHRWHVAEHPEGHRSSGPYATGKVRQSNGKLTSKRMHILIMGRPYIDHIDHNGLNNQRWNLRPATASQNQANSRRALHSASIYKGVFRSSDGRKWRAGIGVNRKLVWLGSFANEDDAALAYNVAAAEAFGEFALLNEIRTAA